METYLMHHGIKGQRWGIRRYQNEDGSYTPAGKKRYGKVYDRAEKYALKRGTSKETAKEYANAKSRQFSQYERTQDSAQKVDNVLGLSPKRWKTWHNDYKDLKEANRAASSAKNKVKNEALENKITKKNIKRGVSEDTAKALGKSYVERKIAYKQYSKDYNKMAYGFPFGKKAKDRTDKVIESLNDYWIANDNYKITKIQAGAEARRANGWR